MGLRSSKPKRSKDHTIKNSVKNKHGQQANKFREQTSDNRHSAKKTGKQNSDIGFQIKKNKNKGKICQIKESAQVADESDTDKEDSTKIKTKETEAPISPKIPIAGSRPSRYKKTREYDFDSDEYGHPPLPQRPSFPKVICSRRLSPPADGPHAPRGTWTETTIFPKKPIRDSRPSRSEKARGNCCDIHDFDHLITVLFSRSLEPDEPFEPDEPCEPDKPCKPCRPCELSAPWEAAESSQSIKGLSPYSCSSSDNIETQISRIDKIIAQGNIPYVPRRNRPAPPPPDLLD